MIEVVGRREFVPAGGVPWWRRAFGWLNWPVGLSMARPDGLQQPHTGPLAGTSQDGWAQRREVAHAPTAAGVAATSGVALISKLGTVPQIVVAYDSSSGMPVARFPLGG